MKTPRQLGQILQGVRRDKGLTQTTTGARVGIEQSEISKLEANPATASLERIFKLLSALELEVFIRDRALPQAARKRSASSKKAEW